MGNAYGTGEPVVKWSVGSLRWWNDNIKIDVIQVGFENVHWIELAQNLAQWLSLGSVNKILIIERICVKVHFVKVWLVCSLFNDAFTVTGLYSIGDRAKENDDELKRIWWEAVMA
jgi:hypothetical protein